LVVPDGVAGQDLELRNRASAGWRPILRASFTPSRIRRASRSEARKLQSISGCSRGSRLCNRRLPRASGLTMATLSAMAPPVGLYSGGMRWHRLRPADEVTEIRRTVRLRVATPDAQGSGRLRHRRRVPGAAVDELLLQGREEAIRDRVIEAVALAAHRLRDAGWLERTAPA